MNMLDKIQYIQQYGFLFNEYDQRAYYWELVKQFQKLAIEFILMIYASQAEEVKTKCILI